jgi:hypothetical protein
VAEVVVDKFVFVGVVKVDVALDGDIVDTLSDEVFAEVFAGTEIDVSMV